MGYTLEEIKDRLNADPLDALTWLMPNGRIIRGQFHCGDVYGKAPRKGNNGSFCFHPRKLLGRDFNDASHRGYKGIYDVFVAHYDHDQKRALQAARDFLKIPPVDRPKPVLGHDNGGGRRKKPSNIEVLEVIFPAPATSPQFPPAHQKSIVCHWCWRHVNGNIAGYSYRMEFTDQQSGNKTKLVLPLTWCRLRNKETGKEWTGWYNKGLPHPQPLLHARQLADAQNVLIVEGEKTADAGNLLTLQADHPLSIIDKVSTWHGGTKRLDYVDWSPLKGKNIWYWPDADRPGKSGHRGGYLAGEQLPAILSKEKIECRYRLIDPGCDVPPGWDLADPLPEGLGTDWISNRMENAEVFL